MEGQWGSEVGMFVCFCPVGLACLQYSDMGLCIVVCSLAWLCNLVDEHGNVAQGEHDRERNMCPASYTKAPHSL